MIFRRTAFFLTALFVFSCGSSPGSTKKNASPSDQLRNQVELGSPSSLTRAAELLQGEAANSQQNRVLGFVASALAKQIYPGLDTVFSVMETPDDSGYVRIIREAERGIYVAPASSSRDFLEYTLPFLACYTEDTSVVINRNYLRTAIPHLERAALFNKVSILPHLFRGFALEKMGENTQARTAYSRVLELNGSCYPAELGLIRLLQAQGRFDEAVTQLNDLLRIHPGNSSIHKQLTRLYAEQRNWQRAETLITEILKNNGRDGEFLLLRARIRIEQGLFQQAQQPLDAYADIDRNNRQYILLRARILAEGTRNREGAISLLRPLVISDPNDADTALYLSSLLLVSSRKDDTEEGRRLLNRFLDNANAVSGALALAAADSIERENWREAKIYLDRLLTRRRNVSDLYNAWKTERALGNNTAALSYAGELYDRESSSDNAISAYAVSLIDAGRQSEAALLIDQRLNSVPGGVRKSLYYYLRSRTRNDDNAALNDLRSALFENSKNLDALTAMFEIYHNRKDERRAVYYLKQALVIAPNNPQLKRYEQEYRSLLEN